MYKPINSFINNEHFLTCFIHDSFIQFNQYIITHKIHLSSLISYKSMVKTCSSSKVGTIQYMDRLPVEWVGDKGCCRAKPARLFIVLLDPGNRMTICFRTVWIFWEVVGKSCVLLVHILGIGTKWHQYLYKKRKKNDL